jgi:hypothetical protein
MKPDTSLPDPAALRALTLQMHLELMDLLRHPLYRHVKKQMTHADFFKSLMEAFEESNRTLGVVR